MKTSLNVVVVVTDASKGSMSKRLAIEFGAKVDSSNSIYYSHRHIDAAPEWSG
jgi:hypothetical protein